MNRIIASCSYPNNNIATGFQLIGHDPTKVHKLYTNRTTTNRQAPVSLLLEANQIYQITIFAIKSGTGIVNGMVYSAPHQLVPNSASSITTSSVTPNGIATAYYVLMKCLL